MISAIENPMLNRTFLRFRFHELWLSVICDGAFLMEVIGCWSCGAGTAGKVECVVDAHVGGMSELKWFLELRVVGIDAPPIVLAIAYIGC